MNRLIALAALALVAACAGGDSKPDTSATLPAAVDATSWPASVGRVDLQYGQSVSDEQLLDVGLVIFDPGIPEDKSQHSRLGVFPEIRKAEAGYLPVLLREVLVESNAWGVVRVLPKVDTSSELLLTGVIVHSDGLQLVIDITVTDATDRVWLQRRYHDETTASDYPPRSGRDPYTDLYRQIANDLLAVRRQQSKQQLQTVRRVGRLRYAQSLSPDAFAGYLGEQGGEFQLLRYPADEDPMMQRVQRIRNQEYLFIDNIDEQYASLQEDMRPTYDLWRQYGREQAIYREDYQDRVAERDRQGRRGSYAAMQQAYGAYRSSKIQEQDLRELAGGFNNEVAPTVMESSGKIFRLGGTLDSQYADWRGILKQIFALETGLPETQGQ